MFKKNKNLKGGYTFIELIVVIVIFSIVSSVVLFNFSDFSTNISLQNTTSDIALQIKEAQSDAIAGKLNDAIVFLGQTNYKPAYGIHFDIDVKPREFKKFTDLDKSREYDGGSGNCDVSDPECLKKVSINGFDQIDTMCVRTIYDSPSDCNIVDILDISFERPFPDAIIRAENDGVIYNDAEIVLVSSKGVKRKIIINALGSITTEAVGN